MLFTVNERSLKVWLNQIALWDINEQNGGLSLLWNLLFQISSNFVTFQTNFRDGFLNTVWNARFRKRAILKS